MYTLRYRVILGEEVSKQDVHEYCDCYCKFSLSWCTEVKHQNLILLPVQYLMLHIHFQLQNLHYGEANLKHLNPHNNEWHLNILTLFISHHNFNNEVLDMVWHRLLANLFHQLAKFHRESLFTLLLANK